MRGLCAPLGGRRPTLCKIDRSLAGGLMLERRTNRAKRQVFEDLRRDLVRRLERVCGDWSAPEVERLAATVTRIRLKYESRTALPERM